MGPAQCGLALAANDYGPVAVLVLVGLGLAALILAATFVVGPKRHGPVKDSTYESGMDPIGDTRRRFNVRFYLVAVMYVVFSVEVVFLYPWALAFTQLRGGLTQYQAAEAAGKLAKLPAVAPNADTMLAVDAHRLANLGYGPGFMLLAAVIFFGLLAVGLIYEWRKGVFRWD
jgi:NADH-quinone oxidoreductase subunit A